ncbi:hypothetical protein F5Y16DRAFT_422091 [Xylariaceae sp. FL0255]|nr:hypothetical protein F5Y16DRAFT_422091 [Xylariaceae sp. FL0255]
MSEKRPRTKSDSDDEKQDTPLFGLAKRRPSFKMSEEEWAARVERRLRFEARKALDKIEQSELKDFDTSPQKNTEGESIDKSLPLPSAPAPGDDEPKPWESLVIGSVGDDLSNIERKDREIEQQRFIVAHYERNSPHQVAHNRAILDRLIEEREHLSGIEENYMPESQRDKEKRIKNRLDVLEWALQSSQCDDERNNIKAAIQGYHSGQISYSLEFTLIYGGHIVDTCKSYQTFSAERTERLDRYFDKYGPGWIWYEPPLAGSNDQVIAMKGMASDRRTHDPFGVGMHRITQKYEVQKDKVFRGSISSNDTISDTQSQVEQKYEYISIYLDTLLDSGCTLPLIFDTDLARLQVDVTTYPAQGAADISVVGGSRKMRFYEMRVSVTTPQGDTLVGDGNEATWPDEDRLLGGLFPVIVQKHPGGSDGYLHRLSGFVPFEACYISSAPNKRRLWFGEDRRDVLGTSRLPAHCRYDSNKVFDPVLPQEFEDLKKDAQTPSKIIFFHEYPHHPGVVFTDTDVRDRPGKSELTIGRWEPKKKNVGGGLRKSDLIARKEQRINIEPRKGVGVITAKKYKRRQWRKMYKMP